MPGILEKEKTQRQASTRERYMTVKAEEYKDWKKKKKQTNKQKKTQQG